MKLITTLGCLLLLLANITYGQKVLERGLAEVIPGNQSTNKYLIMHPAHPRGTLLRVRNPANGKSVDARVIGSMRPKYRVIIQVSKSIYEDLNARGKKFAVEILHAPVYERRRVTKPRTSPKIIAQNQVIKPKRPSQLNSRVLRTQTLFHTVQRGETLYRISRKYKVSVDDLKEWNNLINNNLTVGQDLVITIKK
ncbi:hypothetical protein BKI52_26500 [marine bacterium AO1-C]|nr:hypothetical protein BKI52_26500 [marine bacterium AO1-C]